MPDQDTTQAQVVEQVKGTTMISFTHPTPMWATWIFRIEFFLNKAVLIWMGGTHAITPEQIKESLVTIAAIDFFVWGIGKSIGVKPPEEK